MQIARRIDRAEAGNLGDIKRFDGIGEMRIKSGPAYRLYFFFQRGEALIILLCGGTKRRQQRDIETAKAMAEELEDDATND